MVQDVGETLGVKQAPREGAYEREGEGKYVVNKYSRGAPKPSNIFWRVGPL